MRNDLRDAFETKSWTGRRGRYPRSGPGSSLEFTANLRAALPSVLKRYAVRTFLDAPCGDWFWMQSVDLSGIDYIGADISGELIAANQARFARENVQFVHLDITSDPLPKAELVLCRDCLFHLEIWLRWTFFENFAASGSMYLLQTMHHVHRNRDLTANGGFRRFNPILPPFNFPPPLELVDETQDGAAEGDRRSLGLWSREQIIEVLSQHAQEVISVQQ